MRPGGNGKEEKDMQNEMDKRYAVYFKAFENGQINQAELEAFLEALMTEEAGQ